MTIRGYLRASTEDKNAERAREQLEAFAAEQGADVVAWYVENVSGATLARPELFKLLRDARPGDVLLVEQVDRLSRLSADDWQKLRSEIDRRIVRIVALDLPTSWMLLAKTKDDFTARMFAAINAMMLDVLAAVARKDYEDRRRRRQAEGQAKAKAAGRYKGRPENAKRNRAIAHLLERGLTWSQVQAASGCSRATVAKLARRAKETTTSH